jgi:hypothetical protein
MAQMYLHYTTPTYTAGSDYTCSLSAKKTAQKIEGKKRPRGGCALRPKPIPIHITAIKMPCATSIKEALEEEIKVLGGKTHKGVRWEDTDRGKFVTALLEKTATLTDDEEDEYFHCARGDWVYRKDDPDCGYCEGEDTWWCETCLEHGRNDHCDEMECVLCHGDDPFRCDSCKAIRDGNNDPQWICLKRGVYCEDCWDENDSLEVCRKNGCEMCDDLYKRELKVSENLHMLPGYTMTAEEEKEVMIKSILSATADE